MTGDEVVEAFVVFVDGWLDEVTVVVDVDVAPEDGDVVEVVEVDSPRPFVSSREVGVGS